MRAEFLIEEKQVNIQRACRLVNLSRSQWYYQTKRDDSEVINSLEKLALDLPTRGFDCYYGRLRVKGHKWNRKRVLRVYRKLNLALRRKRKRRLPARIKQPLVQPKMINRTWSMDFMHDSLEYGRKIRVFNVLDDFSREALAVEADYSHNGESIVHILEELIWTRGIPQAIRSDNGPEFTSKTYTAWCKAHDIIRRVKSIGHKTGARTQFFKENEGKSGDGVCALYDDPDSNLRLYCIRFGLQLLVIGGGGHKPKTIRALQEHPKLKAENYFLRELSSQIMKRIRHKDIEFTNGGFDFKGDLEFEYEEA